MVPDQGPTQAAEDLTPEQIAAMFNDGFSDMKSQERTRQPFLPRINLCVPRTKYKDKKGVELGDWYLTPGDTPQGEEPKYENLGKKFECVVLHDSMQLSVREDDGKTIIESTEFKNFSGEPVFLFDARNGPMHIAAVAPYSGNAVHTLAKIRKDPRFPTKMNQAGTEQVSALGFDFNVYVLLMDGRVCVLQNTKRGHFGTDPETGITCDFKTVADNSFIRAKATCHEATPGLTLGHRWAIGSVKVGGGEDEPRPAFKIMGIGDPSRLREIRAKAEELQNYLLQKWTDRIGYAWGNTSPAQREKLITAYTEVRPLLDTIGGHEIAAMIALGKKAPPALLSEPEPDYQEMRDRNEEEVQKKVKELETELDQNAGAPANVVDVDVHVGNKAIDVPAIDYGSDVKIEDLPF